jgi:hypothetical protein
MEDPGGREIDLCFKTCYIIGKAVNLTCAEVLMKKLSLFLILVASLIFTSLTPVFAGISGTVYGAFAGRYLWRGQLLSDTPVIQPGVSVGLNKFTLDWWGSYSIDTGLFEESDYRVSFTDSVPFIPLLSASSGYWIYTHPSVLFTSNELFGTLSVDVPSKPYISYYFDPIFGKGGYAELGVSQELEFFGIGINGGLNAGYNFGDNGYTPSFTAAAGTIGASYTFAGIKINPVFTGQYSLDKQYKSLGTWMVNISYGFAFEEDSTAPAGDSASK